MNSDRPTVTVIASGKGGVGKTLLAACLGSILQNNLKHQGQLLLADLDFGVKGLTFLYGAAGEWKGCSGSMMDILWGRRPPESVLLSARTIGDVSVIPADIEFERKVDWDKYYPSLESMLTSIGRFLDEANDQRFEHVIFDTGAGLDKPIMALATYADKIIVVVEPDEISLTAAVDLWAELSDYKERLRFVVNKEPNDYPQKINDNLKGEITFLPALPFDQRLHARFVKDARELARVGFRRTRYRRYVEAMASELFGISGGQPTMWDRILRKKSAKIFLQFVGYGLGFMCLSILLVIALVWLTSAFDW